MTAAPVPIERRQSRRPGTPRGRAVTAGFLLALLAFGAIGAFSYFSLTKLIASSGKMRHTGAVLQGLEELRADVTTVETNQRGYLITGGKSFRHAYDGALVAIQSDLVNLRNLTVDNARQQASLGAISPLVDARVGFMRETMRLRDQQGVRAAEQRIVEGTGERMMISIRDRMEEMEAEETRLLGEQSLASVEHARTAKLIIVGGSVVTILIAILAVLTFRRGLRERQQILDALRAQDATLGSFYNSAPMMMGIVELTPDGIALVSHNEAAKEFFTSAHGVESPTTVNDLNLRLESTELWVARYMEAKARGKPMRYEYEHVAPGGNRWLASTVGYVGQGPTGLPRFSYIAEDITARRDAEVNLMRDWEIQQAVIEVQQAIATAALESSEVMQKITDYALRLTHADGAGVLLHEADDVVVRAASGTTADHIGLRMPVAASLVGMCFRTGTLLRTDDAETDPRTDKPGIRLLQARSLITFPLRRATETIGVLAVMSSRPGAFTERDEQAIQLVGGLISAAFTHEAAEQANQLLMTALRSSKETAEAANLAKSNFLATMSHELRTPLNAVIGFANILRKNKAGNLTAQDLDFLDRIQQNGRHLLGLINDVLDLSKVEAGRMELELGPVALDALIRDIVAQIAAAPRKPGVELRTELPDAAAPMMLDRARFSQVLINLVGNALKFTESGSVTVRLELDPTTQRPRTLQVIDTGIGIAPERQGAIFEAFQQAESSTTRAYGGTGLGLTISRSIVGLMGATVAVSSVPGKGSTFTIGFPDAAGSPPAAAASARPAPERRRGLILVVDDEADSRTVITHFVEEAGYQTISAASGDEALAAARAHRPDLITLDLLMPGLSGWEILKLLKADLTLRDTPVVIVSFVVREDQGSVLGAVDVVRKPVTPDDLVRAVGRNITPFRKRILVVDDEADIRHLFQRLLEDAGYTVALARNGEEALSQLNASRPDLIVLDLGMPVMDGRGFLHTLRRDLGYIPVPVVVISGEEIDSPGLRRLESLATAVIRKGADLETDLREVLDRTLGSRHPRDSAAASA